MAYTNWAWVNVGKCRSELRCFKPHRTRCMAEILRAYDAREPAGLYTVWYGYDLEHKADVATKADAITLVNLYYELNGESLWHQ